ncbi:unnamed protein product [Penicillium nalgiovense]|uniref:DUF6536 domain-containing protein n=1 Tax=Penicillium nalgiovense TaxID=60175 RepID=A0A9W4HTM0_PENNA|nr:unnamed protein product [Penicillium nalgiovense]CAG7950576.1 unnamed protein product [Penicillium nalgiovense]CAG7988847.1 unnamed protein product [Penicillium nalgiovense]CAG7990771.1 unnamed protein product [Penicillium nalgiovense]CAG7997836.1 unnamed protein product [Penicillium nalgiovense]
MSNRGSLDHDTELLPIPYHHQSADLLIQSTSERGSERYSERDTERVSVHNEGSKPKHSWLFQSGDRFQGWRFTIFLAFIASLIVFLFNLGFMVYTISHHRQDDRKGILYQGDCDKVHHLDIGFHLLINILSTTLLSASNFGMQCLAAPTRRNIDRAHQKGKWLDIGVPSIRNLFRVSKGRSLLWICLASSSLPFHLMYNSTIFSTTSVTAYHIFLGNGDLGKIPSPELEAPRRDKDKWSSFNGLLSSAKNESLHHLGPKECVDNYAQTFQTTYGDLLLVTEQVSTNTSYVYLTMQGVFNPQRYLDLEPPGADPYGWLCPNDWGDDCEVYLPTIQSQIKEGNWTVPSTSSSGGGWKVDYCLAEKVRQFCKLQYSFPLTMVVITFNLVKSAILCYMWFGMREAPILTIGDAITSFLRRPDPHTKGGCLLLNREAESVLFRYSPASIKKYPLHEPRKYVGKRRRWGSAVSTRRWVFSISFWLIAILACILLLVYGISQIKTGSAVWRATLGEVNASTLIKGDHWPGTLIPIVIIANIPQLIFSFLYFAFNSLLTAMNIAAEWSRFAVNRKGLRISGSPSLSQRSNYFLSLPYRYALPLMGVSALLHWLISRSLYMVGIDAYGPSMERQPDNDFLTCGYSPVAIVSSIAVGSVMFFCLVGLSFRLFESGMPVVGSCSFTIATACHPTFDPNRQGNGEVDVAMEWENEDEDMALLPVQWGSVPVVGPVGHCSFTSGDVEEPSGEQKYL